MRYLLRVTITIMIIFIFGSLPEWSSIKAQQPDSTQEPIHYKRNDNTFLESYNANDKPKYSPLDKSVNGTGVWTELNPNVPRVDYIGVDFINPDTGWAVGLWGAAIKTTNGGQSWTTLETPTGEILLKVHSYNGQVVMVVGHNGTILRSSDGGESFTQLTGITTQELWGVRMLNDTLGWICGRNQTLLKTTDAGLTWQPVVTGFNYHYWSFDFLPVPSGTENYFMIACSQGKVLKTTDGGQSFTQYQAGSLQDLYTIDIIDSLYIAAAGNFGKNVYSSDGGATWTENQYTSLSINWIQFINKDTGYITIESAQLRKTTDRGQNWFNPGFGAAGEWQFELLNKDLGYGVGAGLTVTKTEDGYTTGRNLILNVDFRDVFFFTETTGFALSWFLYKTTDGGISWQRKENAPGGKDILFLDTLTGFIGGSNLFKTTDGGESWYQVNGVPGGVGKIFFVNPFVGWATSGRNILKTTDGGENWVVQFTHINDSFTSIFFIDSLYGWATSRYVHQTTDGGLSWIQRTDIQILLSDDVYFSNLDIGWIAGYLITPFQRALHKTTDSGLSWNVIVEVEDARKFYVFPDPIYWISNGFSKEYITTNGGQTWVDITMGFNNFYAPNNNIGYAVGSLGLILRYDDSAYVPVEFSSFTGFYSFDKVELYWTTESETNNYGFEVWRSSDLNKWERLNFITGSGTTAQRQYYTFVDKYLNNHKLYYKLKQIDFDGSYKFSELITVNIPIKDFNLNQNYPNPANPVTNISFIIPQKSFVNINLYSITGRLVRQLINEEKNKGIYNLEINLSNLSSGVYFYRMITDNGYQSTKKLIILK